jgi:putative transposase
MGQKGRSDEEIVQALHQVEGGEKVAEVCRRLGVSEQTFYRWKNSALGSASGSCDRCATRIASCARMNLCVSLSSMEKGTEPTDNTML